MKHNVFVDELYGRDSAGFIEVANQMIEDSNSKWSGDVV